MSEDISDRMPEDVPVRLCINVMVGITRSKVISLGFANKKWKLHGNITGYAFFEWLYIYIYMYIYNILDSLHPFCGCKNLIWGQKNGMKDQMEWTGMDFSQPAHDDLTNK